MALGLDSGRLALVQEHAAWADEFARERERILAILGAHIVAVEHVGSTALPGVPAKPILDIQIGVASFEAAQVCIEPMQSLGYEYRGEYGIPRRHYFAKGAPRTHHVHMLEVDGETWRSMLTFRDALLARPDLAQEYGAAKVELAVTHSNDRTAYQEAKGSVIARLLARWTESAQPICLGHR